VTQSSAVLARALLSSATSAPAFEQERHNGFVLVDARFDLAPMPPVGSKSIWAQESSSNRAIETRPVRAARLGAVSFFDASRMSSTRSGRSADKSTHQTRAHSQRGAR